MRIISCSIDILISLRYSSLISHTLRIDTMYSWMWILMKIRQIYSSYFQKCLLHMTVHQRILWIKIKLEDKCALTHKCVETNVLLGIYQWAKPISRYRNVSTMAAAGTQSNVLRWILFLKLKILYVKLYFSNFSNLDFQFHTSFVNNITRQPQM